MCELILNWLFPIVVATAAAAAAFRVIRLTKKERNNDIVSWTFILINELAQQFTLPLLPLSADFASFAQIPTSATTTTSEPRAGPQVELPQ